MAFFERLDNFDKILCVGDLHGHLHVAQRALEIASANSWHIVFMGDYLDSFRQSVSDQVDTLNFILDAVESERASALFGNHEWSYLDRNKRATGYQSATAAHIMSMKRRMFANLNDYIWVGSNNEYLISHAGISQKLVNALDIDWNEYLERGEYHQVGTSRWGNDPYGGLYWCDWRHEFEPLKDGPKQIVGHTRHSLIQEKCGSFCIDVIENQVENGEIPQGLLIEPNKVPTIIEIV